MGVKDSVCKEYFSVPQRFADTMRSIGTMLDIKDVDKYIGKREDGEEMGQMCKALEDIREDGIQQGIRQGIAEGATVNLIGIIIKKTNKDKPLIQIADEVEETIEFIRPMYDTIIANPGKDADEIYKIMKNR